MKLVAATNNQHKVNEFIELFGDGFEIICIGDIANGFDPDETGTTFEENALIKARTAFGLTGLPCFADDSGICVDALGGAPGIHSARYAPEGRRKLTVLEKLKGLPTEKRTAHFKCVFAYSDGRTEFTVSGRCDGYILKDLSGSGGFGYDPIFFSNELGKSFGDATAEEKNRISHRAKAVHQFVNKLKEKRI